MIGLMVLFIITSIMSLDFPKDLRILYLTAGIVCGLISTVLTEIGMRTVNPEVNPPQKRPQIASQLILK